VETVRKLREEHPRWGKDKLVMLVRDRGFKVSVSMVGRILGFLRKKGLIRNPDLRDPCIVRRPQIRPYATRKPRDYLPVAPGDLVQVDTADVRLDGSAMVYKHFAARDYVSRWDVLDVHHSATATNAANFLDVILKRMPFPVRAIQVDGGSEFRAEFEAACQAKALLLFVLPPRSPKLNGRVERSNGTHKQEFYQMLDPPDSIAELRQRLRTQEDIYNTIRPHQALGQLTPQQWLLASRERR
jgi:putative transposase